MVQRTYTDATQVESDSAEKLFSQLAAEWRNGRDPVSSRVADMAMHPAYQRIIGMGPAALPFILRELQREPDHWFWALRAITGVDPVPPEARGRLEDMTAAWMQWGREHGYHLPDAIG